MLSKNVSHGEGERKLSHATEDKTEQCTFDTILTKLSVQLYECTWTFKNVL